MFEDSVEALLLIYTEGCGRCMREEVARIREIPLQKRRLCYPYWCCIYTVVQPPCKGRIQFTPMFLFVYCCHSL